MEKHDIYQKLDEIMFSERKRMTREEIIVFLIDLYWATEPKAKAKAPRAKATPKAKEIKETQDGNDFSNILKAMESAIKSVEPKVAKPFRVQLVAKGALTPSLKGTGFYTRHTFRDIDKHTLYILDVSSYTNQTYKNLEIGAVIENPEIFSRGNKNYLNGKKSATYIGHISALKTAVAAKKNILDL
jgi:hypothetical protein